MKTVVKENNSIQRCYVFFFVKGKHNKLNVCWGFFSWGLWDLVGSIIHSNQYKITNKFKSL